MEKDKMWDKIAGVTLKRESVTELQMLQPE